MLSFDLLEDGETITKGGLGRAVVGGITGGRRSKGVCNSIRLKITLRDCHCSVVYIPFIATKMKRNSIVYKSAQSLAQKCISALQIISDSYESEMRGQTV